ncbi:tape measure protein, partial [Bacillus safensis]|uniref:tape measure protein n=3 Tax=Bacillati TaxID=1783272 RepID=UPI003CFFB71C
MTQTSRLVLEVDSRSAEKKLEDVRHGLKAASDAGVSMRPSLALAGASMKDLGDKASSAAQPVAVMRERLSNLALTASRMPVPLAAAATAMLAALKVAKDAEVYTNLSNRLKLVTDSTLQLAYAQQSVFQVAQDARQSMESTAQVYQRIAQNAKQLGLNFGEVASISKTVSQAVALSGASAQAADASMVQFGQALASGTLRGDELNSIMEQTPALAQAIARGLGVTIGQLRTMGADGKLTSEKVVEALQNQKDKVNELSSVLTVTSSQAMTAFNNSLIMTAGNLDKALGASNKFAQSVLALSGVMDRFNSGEFLDYFRDDKQTVAGLNADLNETMSQMRDLGAMRASLMKGQPGDTKFYKFKFYDVDALDKEIAGLEKKGAAINALKARMQKGAADLASQSPTGDAPGSVVNPAYEKLLVDLKKQAALQGQNTELAKVRYAIESGELGKLLPKQEALLLQYAKEKDAKEAAATASKKVFSEDAGTKALDQARQRYAVLMQQNSMISQQGAGVARVGTEAQALIKWEQQLADIKGKKTLTADQKSLLTSQEMITAQLKRNAGLEREAELTKSIQAAQRDQVQLLTLTGQLREANSLKSSLDDAAQMAEYERQGNTEAMKRLETLIKIRDVNLKA